MGKVSKAVATAITASTRFPSSRRPPRTRTAAEIRHIRQVGEIVHAWNHAHGALFHVFSVVVADSDITLAHALWHSLQSDSGQRLMLENVVKEKIPSPRNSMRTAILWSVRALAVLARARNEAAHVEIVGGHDEIMPGMSARTQYALKMENDPLATRWKAIRGDLYGVMNYLDGIYLALWNGFPRPLSRRPRLRSVRLQSEGSQRRNRRAKKATRERQRQSSPA